MKSYKILLRDFLSEYVDALRKRKELSQENMAEQLRITSRAYSDLERGKYCFSTVPLLFLLLMLDDDELRNLLDRFRESIAVLENQNAA